MCEDGAGLTLAGAHVLTRIAVAQVWVCEDGHACANGTSRFFCFAYDNVSAFNPPCMLSYAYDNVRGFLRFCSLGSCFPPNVAGRLDVAYKDCRTLLLRLR